MELLILVLLIAAVIFFCVAGAQSGWPTRWMCFGLALVAAALALTHLPG